MKIWLCVSIVLAGYFVATVSGFYFKMLQYKRLTHLESNNIPIAFESAQLVSLFNNQMDQYETAFLIGEKGLALKANKLHIEILDLINQLIIQSRKSKNLTHLSSQLGKLKTDYFNFAIEAAKIYPKAANFETSTTTHQQIQGLGILQLQLKSDFKNIADLTRTSLHQQLNKNKHKALQNVAFLSLFFLVVLIFVAFFVDRVSRKLLVAPLASIGENVNRFLHHQDVIKPDNTNSDDEIGHLATSFWEMTEKLKKTTVSKEYMNNIIRNMSGALVVVRPDRTIETVNHQAYRLFGYGDVDLINKPVDILFAEVQDESHIGSSIINTVVDAGTIKDKELFCITNDQHQFPVHFSGSAMYSEEQSLQGIICIFNDITNLKNAENKLRKMAHHDALTGLANRNLFFDRLHHTFSDAKRHDRQFAILYLDLDKFKPINDIYGHDIGDMILKKVSNRLVEGVRSDDTVARMGGDEFVIILNAINSSKNAEEIAGKVIKEIIAPFTLNGISHDLEVSVGISVFPDDGLDAESLLNHADAAMYDAKKSGGCKFKRYTA